MLKKKELIKEEIYELYINKNYTLDNLVKYYNIPKITIQRFLRKNYIRKIKSNKELYDNIDSIKEMLKIKTHKEIADYYNTNVNNIRKIIYSKINPNDNIRYSNNIEEDWIDFNNPLFWYIIGIVTTDGHINNKSNTIQIYQKNIEYLYNIQKLIGHFGKIYKSTNIYSLHLTNNKLYNFFIDNNFSTDKRYNVPFIKNIPDNMFKYYLLGIFDGDGCIYYNYRSGQFVNKIFQITSGSYNLVEKLNENLINLNYKSKINYKVSTVGNKYYDLVLSNTNDILNILEWFYDDSSKKFCLKRKYISYVKLLKIIEIDNLKI